VSELKFEPVIGLEIHAQLLTESKIFCRCSAQFGGKANEQVCPICIGMPGVLPVLNKRAVEFAVKLALATNCTISKHSIFARKNYFYPDLPKGYQISQYEEPLGEHGALVINTNGQSKRIGITRIHLEEDAGKSMHAETYVSKEETLLDLNRCGVPLIEIVTEPDLRSPQEAYNFLIQLRQLLIYLEVCDGNMEEGSLRCDANVSVRPKGSKEFGVKTELKNMNSFHGVQNALEFEIKRQIELLTAGDSIVQETLLWNAEKGIVEIMRSKEFAHDYRYFPDPDLVPLEIDNAWILTIRETLPEMPWDKKARFKQQYGLPEYDCSVLTDDLYLADYFEACVKKAKNKKSASNWIMGEVLRVVNDEKITIDQFPIQPQQLAEMLNLIHDGTITGKVAKTVFQEMIQTGKDAKAIVSEKGLTQISDITQIETVVNKVLDDNPNEVATYLNGKQGVVGFFVGEVMKRTKGKANPQMVNQILLDRLKYRQKN